MPPEFNTPIQTTTSPSSSKGRLLIILGLALIFLVIAATIFYLVVIKKGSIPDALNELPFGEEAPNENIDLTQNPNGDKLGDIALPGNVVSKARLFQITDQPILGAVFRNISTTTGVVRYTLSENTHVLEFDPDLRTSRELSNTTISARAQEAVWDARGQNFLLRYLFDTTTIGTYLERIAVQTGTTTPDQSPATLTQEYLPNDILSAGSGPEGGYALIVETAGGGAELRTLGKDGKFTTHFNSPFTEWLTEWPSKKYITLLTKSSALVEGYFLTIDTKTGESSQLLGGILGLTAKMSPDGNAVLVGSVKNKKMQFDLRTRADGWREQALGVGALPEKCVFAKSSKVVYCAVPNTPPTGTYPDAWYQGLVSFNDTIWLMDLETFVTLPLVTPQSEVEVKTQIDATNLFLSSDEDYLFFTNKRDNTLWGFDLTALGAGQQEGHPTP